MKKLPRSAYPALYQAADRASLDAQRDYLRAIKGYLWLLLVGATLTVYADSSKGSAIAAAIVFLASLGVALLQAFKRFDRIWYNGRAVAESVKTRTWRYMMRAEPYEDADAVERVRKEFCSDLEQILKQNRELAPHIGGDPSLARAVSSEMEAVRRLSVPERLDVYTTARIDEQREWYARKSSENRRRERQWFVGMIALHAIAITLLLFQVATPTLTWLPTEVAVVGAGSVLTWIQVKKFQDNRSAFSLAAHEITLIREQSGGVDSEASLSDFVKDAENAFSREHTQWVARRDK